MPQSDCPRSSKRKRQREGQSLIVEPHTCQSATLHRDHYAASRREPPSHASKATRPASATACQNTQSYYTAICTCLMQWSYRLKALQPKCIITKEVVHRSLDLFHRYRQSCQADQSSSNSEGKVHLTATDLAACLWLASKSDGNRACVPSRTLLTRAVNVCPDELSQAELSICCKLKWNILNSQVSSALQH